MLCSFAIWRLHAGARPARKAIQFIDGGIVPQKILTKILAQCVVSDEFLERPGTR